MKRFAVIFFVLHLSLALVSGDEPSAEFEKNWPQWRGPEANGVAPFGNPPVQWSESENIKWKIELPGLGHATPIIWNNRIFILTAVNTSRKVDPGEGKQTKAKRGMVPFTMGTTDIHKYMIIAVNRSDGQIEWQHTAREELPNEGIQKTSSWASISPVTDGEHVYAYFGSKGLYCYDMQGNLKWEKDLGDMNIKHNWGEGSSPVLYNDKIVVKWDHEDQSFITALDKKTGREIWKVSRDEGTSWSTPLIVESKGQAQVITNATNHIRSYDLATGDLIWESSGMGAPEVIPTPVAANDMVYLFCGGVSNKASRLKAVNLLEASGDITASTAIAWSLERDAPYVPSPLLYDNMLYFSKGNDGTLACFKADTGEEYYTRKRTKGIGTVYASPVAAGGRIYLSSRNGVTQVIKHGPQYEFLATNKLDDSFSASPAVAGNELFLRGEKYLYCITED